MGQNNKDVEKIKKAQIAARDPGPSKIKGYDWSKHNKKAQRIAKQKKEKSFIADFFEILPNRWKGAIYGLLFGGLIAAFLAVVVLAPEMRLLALVPLLFGGLVGFILGKLFEEKIPR